MVAPKYTITVYHDASYYINATTDVTIDPSHGKCIYVIVPGPPMELTIERFIVSSDQIDVTLFISILNKLLLLAQ